MIVRVNDRGPFYSDRVIDLSFAAAKDRSMTRSE
ncbi:RlpA-like double-psi beta-barrel domain-containing protein [Pseudomonas aeruginosa]